MTEVTTHGVAWGRPQLGTRCRSPLNDRSALSVNEDLVDCPACLDSHDPGSSPASPLPEGRADGRATAYVVSDGPKMLKETLCVAQSRIGNSPLDQGRKAEHVARLQRLIDECDRHRPIGSDGKHGDRHTSACGCDLAAPVVAVPEAGERGLVTPYVAPTCGNADCPKCHLARADGLDALVDRFIAANALTEPTTPQKVREEVAEFCDDPTPEEGADVVLAVLIELRVRGWSLADLMAAAAAKAAVNLSRTWERQPDGTIHHVAAPEHPAPAVPVGVQPASEAATSATDRAVPTRPEPAEGRRARVLHLHRAVREGQRGIECNCGDWFRTPDLHDDHRQRVLRDLGLPAVPVVHPEPAPESSDSVAELVADTTRSGDRALVTYRRWVAPARMAEPVTALGMRRGRAWFIPHAEGDDLYSVVSDFEVVSVEPVEIQPVGSVAAAVAAVRADRDLLAGQVAAIRAAAEDKTGEHPLLGAPCDALMERWSTPDGSGLLMRGTDPRSVVQAVLRAALVASSPTTPEAKK